MARHDRISTETVCNPLSVDEVRALLGGHVDAGERSDAIACYLSASEGWEAACGKLGGAFAEEGARLRERKGGSPPG